MFLTLFLALVFCAAITILLLSAVAFVQDKKFFSSAQRKPWKSFSRERKNCFTVQGQWAGC